MQLVQGCLVTVALSYIGHDATLKGPGVLWFFLPHNLHPPLVVFLLLLAGLLDCCLASLLVDLLKMRVPEILCMFPELDLYVSLPVLILLSLEFGLTDLGLCVLE